MSPVFGCRARPTPVADAGGEHLHVLAAGIGHHHIGAPDLDTPVGAEGMVRRPGLHFIRRLPRDLLGHVGARAHGDEHFRAVGGEDHVASGVAALAVGELGNHHLGLAPRLQVARAIGKAHDRIDIGHIDPLRIGGRVEGDAEGAVELVGENFRLGGGGRTVLGPQDADAIGVGLGHEHVAVGGGAHQARRIQLSVGLDGEAGKGLEAGVSRLGDHGGHGRRHRGGHGRGHVRRRDLAHHAGRIGAEVAVSGRARALLRQGRGGAKSRQGGERQNRRSNHGDLLQSAEDLRRGPVLGFFAI